MRVLRVARRAASTQDGVGFTWTVLGRKAAIVRR